MVCAHKHNGFDFMELGQAFEGNFPIDFHEFLFKYFFPLSLILCKYQNDGKISISGNHLHIAWIKAYELIHWFYFYNWIQFLNKHFDFPYNKEEQVNLSQLYRSLNALLKEYFARFNCITIITYLKTETNFGNTLVVHCNERSKQKRKQTKNIW